MVDWNMLPKFKDFMQLAAARGKHVYNFLWPEFKITKEQQAKIRIKNMQPFQRYLGYTLGGRRPTPLGVTVHEIP